MDSHSDSSGYDSNISTSTARSRNSWTGFDSDVLEKVTTEILETARQHVEKHTNRYLNLSNGHYNFDTDKSLHFIKCEIENPEKRVNKPVVICHGYMSGAVSFINTLINITLYTGRTAYAVDWLGMAGSSRPKFTPTNTEETVDWLLEPLVGFLSAQGLTKFDLIGHSTVCH